MPSVILPIFVFGWPLAVLVVVLVYPPLARLVCLLARLLLH
jgi:hypothetical protein